MTTEENPLDPEMREALTENIAKRSKARQARDRLDAAYEAYDAKHEEIMRELTKEIRVSRIRLLLHFGLTAVILSIFLADFFLMDGPK